MYFEGEAVFNNHRVQHKMATLHEDVTKSVSRERMTYTASRCCSIAQLPARIVFDHPIATVIEEEPTLKRPIN